MTVLLTTLTGLQARLTAVKLPPLEVIHDKDAMYTAFLPTGTLPESQATVTNRVKKAGLRLVSYGTLPLAQKEYLVFEVLS